MMPNVEFLVIAVRNHYHNSDDFKSIFQFLETLYISGKLQLPLKGIVLIGLKTYLTNKKSNQPWPLQKTEF